MKMVPFFYNAFLIGTVLLSVQMLGCDKDIVSQSGKDLELTTAENDLVRQSNRFAFSLYKEALQNLKPSDNALISPLSVQTALAMTWQGARNSTKQAMAEALFLQDVEKNLVNTYFQKLIRDLPLLDPQTKLDIANSIWHRQQFQVIPAFLDVNQQYFKAQVQSADFADPATVNQINSWVSDRTHGKIDQIVDQLNDDLMMLLINAVYFKGNWEHPFDPADTYTDIFHHGTDAAYVLQTDYMNMERRFAYKRTPKWEAAELPYGNKKYSMLLIKPAEGLTASELAMQLADGSEGVALMDLSDWSTVLLNISLPKFTFSYANELSQELSALGMGEAFSDAADFTGIHPDGRLLISEVRHKSFIEVNEEGSEAAAVTSVEIVLTSLPQVYELKLDRPFIFLIREMSSGLILFMGQLNNPQSEATDLT